MGPLNRPLQLLQKILAVVDPIDPIVQERRKGNKRTTELVSESISFKMISQSIVCNKIILWKVRGWGFPAAFSFFFILTLSGKTALSSQKYFSSTGTGKSDKDICSNSPSLSRIKLKDRINYCCRFAMLRWMNNGGHNFLLSAIVSLKLPRIFISSCWMCRLKWGKSVSLLSSYSNSEMLVFRNYQNFNA